MFQIKIVPGELQIEAALNVNLMAILQEHGIYLDAPCGGNGKCHKCKVIVNGEKVLACAYTVDRDLEVILPQRTNLEILQSGIAVRSKMEPLKDGHLLAFDLGTTSVVCFLLDGRTGAELAKSSMLKPQTAFGADVVSRIHTIS